MQTNTLILTETNPQPNGGAIRAACLRRCPVRANGGFALWTRREN